MYLIFFNRLNHKCNVKLIDIFTSSAKQEILECVCAAFPFISRHFFQKPGARSRAGKRETTRMQLGFVVPLNQESSRERLWSWRRQLTSGSSGGNTLLSFDAAADRWRCRVSSPHLVDALSEFLLKQKTDSCFCRLAVSQASAFSCLHPYFSLNIFIILPCVSVSICVCSRITARRP